MVSGIKKTVQYNHKNFLTHKYTKYIQNTHKVYKNTHKNQAKGVYQHINIG